jgi:hypothetical protein
MSEWKQVGAYAIKTPAPGHVVMSRKPEDVQAAMLEALRPAIEALKADYAAQRILWALTHRTRSRIVTRNKQQRSW